MVNRLVDKTSRLMQCVVVSMALCFVIVPHGYLYAYSDGDGPSYPIDDGGQGIGGAPAGDLDGDGIPDETDVCPKSSYDYDYHERCLANAGLLMIESGKVLDAESTRANFEEWERDGRKGNCEDCLVFQPYHGIEYEAIKTCDDLNEYENSFAQLVSEIKAVKDTLSSLLFVAGIAIPFALPIAIIGGGFLLVTYFSVSSELSLAERIEQSAEYTHRKLCSRR